MTPGEKVTLINRMLAPLMLVLCPAALVFIYTAPSNADDHVSTTAYVVATSVLVIGFILAVRRCRTEYGWFSWTGRKKF
jgi:hypothetical protein